MPPAGFEPSFSASERPQTDRPLGSAVLAGYYLLLHTFDFGTVVRKWAFVFDALTWLRAERSRVRFLAEAGDLYPPKRPDRLWDPPRVPSTLSPGLKRPGREAATHLHLVPWGRVYGKHSNNEYRRIVPRQFIHAITVSRFSLTYKPFCWHICTEGQSSMSFPRYHTRNTTSFLMSFYVSALEPHECNRQDVTAVLWLT
jgi:hypothetical protein